MAAQALLESGTTMLMEAHTEQENIQEPQQSDKNEKWTEHSHQ